MIGITGRGSWPKSPGLDPQPSTKFSRQTHWTSKLKSICFMYQDNALV